MREGGSDTGFIIGEGLFLLQRPSSSQRGNSARFPPAKFVFLKAPASECQQ